MQASGCAEASDPSNRQTAGIRSELSWRQPADDLPVGDSPLERMSIARWTLTGDGEHDTGYVSLHGRYIIAISLRPTEIRFCHEGSTVFEGRVSTGMFQVTSPGDATRAVFQAGCDVLHLIVQEAEVSELSAELGDNFDFGDMVRRQPGILRDACIERLGNALLLGDQSLLSYGRLYRDGIGLALLARLFDLCGGKRAANCFAMKTARYSK